MIPTNAIKDTRPMAEFTTGINACIQQVTQTKKPLVITEHGQNIAVLVDAEAFETMQARLELLDDINKAENQIKNGQSFTHEQAKAEILKRINA